LYGVIESRLTSVPFIGGAEYSIADMSVFPWIRSQAKRFGPAIEWLREDSAAHPALARWFSAVTERPAVRRALQVFDAISSTLKHATPDDLDRIFGRGRYAVTIAAS
jgi:GST-like protein